MGVQQDGLPVPQATPYKVQKASQPGFKSGFNNLLLVVTLDMSLNLPVPIFSSGNEVNDRVPASRGYSED